MIGILLNICQLKYFFNESKFQTGILHDDKGDLEEQSYSAGGANSNSCDQTKEEDTTQFFIEKRQDEMKKGKLYAESFICT